MKITHEDRLVWGDLVWVHPSPFEMFKRVQCLLGALEETEADLAKERERSKKIAVEAAGYATEVEDLKARMNRMRAARHAQRDRDAWFSAGKRALAELRAAERELERHRHGTTIEGDDVCPDSIALEATRATLAAEREEVVRLDKELGRERASADAALKSMNEQALAQHKRIVELEAALNGTLHAESDEHDASMRQWEERHPAGAEAIALGPRKSKPPCKTPFQPKDIVVEAEAVPKGEHRSGYLVVAGEPQEAKS